MGDSSFSTSLRTLNDFRKWSARDYCIPNPKAIRLATLVRNSTPGAQWVETGTYMGATTKFLAARSKFVYSIEPEPTLFENARKKFASTQNVEIIKGMSQDTLPDLLPKLKGNINFWLDGHYSANETFKGPSDTPIVEELECIVQNMSKFGDVSILIDDVSCFVSQQPEFSGYPPVDFLVDWAREQKFTWLIENDIFIAKNH